MIRLNYTILEWSNILTLTIYLIFLFGAFVRAFFGFGEALVTTPLLIIAGYNLHHGIAIIGIMGFFLALPGAIRNYHAIDWSLLRQLLLGAALGVPAGLLFLKFGSLPALKIFTGICLVLYAIINLLGLQPRRTTRLVPTRLVGIIAGFLGGAINTHGAPVAIYGNMARWSQTYLRANLQTFFAIVGGVIVIGQGLSGLWSLTIFKNLALLVPGFIIIIILVEWLLTRLNPAVFTKILYGFLLLSGILLFV